MLPLINGAINGQCNQVNCLLYGTLHNLLPWLTGAAGEYTSFIQQFQIMAKMVIKNYE